MLVLSCLVNAVPVKADEPIGTVTVTVERFTLGQGYFIEPEEVPIYAGDTGADLLDRVLGGPDTYETKNNSSYGFYLAVIKNADTGVLDIPLYIQEMSGYKITNEQNDGNKHYPGLGEFSYSEKSGWMYMVNNSFPQVGMGYYMPEDGDVVRYQFTLWGTGKDVGDKYDGSGIPIADRDALTKYIAEFNGWEDKDALLSIRHIRDAYDNAMEILQDLTQDQTSVDNALEYLQAAVNARNLQGIRLNKETMQLQYETEEMLELIYDPENCRVDQGVVWSSSDENIVYVDEGYLYATGLGTATITATLGDFTASCQVTVTEESAEKPLTAISLSPAQVSLAKGRTTALRVDYFPADTTDDKTVTWSSDNEQVAQVDAEGRVTALDTGAVVITARVGALTATCQVTVIEEEPPEATEEDQAAAREAVRLASILNTNPNPSLEEVQVVERTYESLTPVQLALLDAEQEKAIQSAVADGYHRVLASVLAVWEPAAEAVQSLVDAGERPDDTSLYNLVQAEKSLNTLKDCQGFWAEDQKTYNQALKSMEDLAEALKDINATDKGVTLWGRSLTLPWTVKVEVEKVAVSPQQQAALAGDNQYLNPTIEAQYRIVLKDFAAAKKADVIPEYDTQGKSFRVILPSGSYEAPALGEHGQLTLVKNDERLGFEDDKGKALVTYSAGSQTFSFSTDDSLGTFAVVSDSRIAIESFVLSSAEKTLLLDTSSPSFQLSVKSYRPYNTTDKDRVSYSSSDPSVASVDRQGVVTGHAKGTAVITADICGVTQQCTVTVKTNRYVDFESYWPTFRKDNSNMAIVGASLPNAGSNLTEKWINTDINTGAQQMTAGTPLVVDNYIYIPTQNNKLYKLDKGTGAIVAEAQLSKKVGFFSYATYGDGMIFVPEEDGTIEAFNADSLDSLWITESFGGQSNCQVTYADGYIYSGTWSGGSNTGTFFCVDASTGGEAYQTNGVRRAKWVSDDNGGYYWSGATVVGDAVIFGGDSGVLQSRNKVTGALIDSYATGGAIRCCIAYDAGTGALYFTAGGGVASTGMTGGGYCWRVDVTESGRFSGAKSTALPAASTTTPVVYNGRVYVTTQKTNGSGHEEDYNKATVIDQSSTENGKLAVLDASSLSLIYQTDVGGPSKASPLLTTAYTADGQQTVYLYITVNNHDGAIVRIKDWAGNITPQAEVIYRAPEDEQEYTTTSLNCDAEGVIYYRNDRGHLIALTGTSEPVRAAAPVESPSRTQRGDGASGSGSSKTSGAGKKAADKADNAAAAGWRFDGLMLPTGGGETAKNRELLKNAGIVLGCSGAALTFLYTLGCALWPKLIKRS
ncbi:MAG: Ig-like domain-containing protein [Eubacterium sp.]|nr:Ig-like domain-containing protein [Eubacterium sp.]